MELLNPYLYAADVKLLSYENAWIQYVKHGEIMENVISPEHRPAFYEYPLRYG